MTRMLRPLGLAGAVLLTLSSLSPVAADAPTPEIAHAIDVVDANGFVAVSETITPQGAVIGTFMSGDTIVKVIGTPGASVSFYPGGSGKQHALGLAMTTTRPKTEAEATRYQDSGRTVVGDLVALGVPREIAEREFGEMETGGAYNPYLTDASAQPSAADAAVLAVPVLGYPVRHHH
jgi:hypothetical protein